jgi:hypothetical protein
MIERIGCLGWLLVLAAGCSSKDGDSGQQPVDTGPSLLGRVFVNEVMVRNVASLPDELGAYPDWIELYNPGDEPYELAGHWITDDVTDPLKHEFPADTPAIEPHGWLVLFADDDEEEGPLHLSFALASAGGDDVALFGPSSGGNALVDSVDVIPPGVADLSYARIPDGGPDLESDQSPTPGAANQP